MLCLASQCPLGGIGVLTKKDEQAHAPHWTEEQWNSYYVAEAADEAEVAGKHVTQRGRVLEIPARKMKWDEQCWFYCRLQSEMHTVRPLMH